MVVLLGASILPAYELLKVYPSFETLLLKSIEKEASRTAKHLLHMFSGVEEREDISLSKIHVTQAGWERLQASAVDFGLWKIRIFSKEGEIIFSTVNSEVGEMNGNDYFFNIVAKGIPFSKIEQKNGKTMEGDTLPLDVVEVYVPIIQRDKFIGAMEVYYDITEQYGMLTSLLLNSGLIFISLMVFIVLTIVFLVIKTAQESQQLLKLHKTLDTKEKIFRDIIDSTHDAIIVTDAEQKITVVNPAFCALTGYQRDETINKTPRILKSGEQDQSFYQQMWQAIVRHKHWQGEIWIKRKDDKVIPELLSISTVEDETDQVTHYVGIYTDISQQKASEQHYQNIAYHDALTGLPNRLLFIEKIDQVLKQSRRDHEKFAIFFLDLDGFKQVNDSAGHDAGDELLKEVSERLKVSVRSQDIVARLGGDEFTIIVHNVQGESVLKLIGNKLLRTINEPFIIEESEFHVGASIGIACYPDDGEDVETLIAISDQAMYEAKRSGKNCIRMGNELKTET